MNVWIFNPFDDILGEGKPQRFWTLASEFSRQGHDVVWWSSSFSHRTKQAREMPDAVDEFEFSLRLVESPPYFRNISFARIRNHRSWGKQLIQDALRLVTAGEIGAPDLIVASMPPMEGACAALELRREFGCKVIVDIMDAWPQTLQQAIPLPSVIGNVLLCPYWHMLRRILAESDGCTAQSYAFAEFARKYGWRGPVEVCYLGARRNEQLLPVSRKPLRGSLKLVYIGAMGRSYDLETLLHAVKFARSQKDPINVELHIAGEGEKLAWMRQFAEDWGNGVVHFHGYLQEEALHELLGSCHVGLIPMYPESGVAVPYKACDYLSYGLPIISSLSGELEQLLNQFECGAHYIAGDVESFYGAIQHYRAMGQATYSTQQERASDLFERSFNRQHTYPAFARNLIESVS